MLVPLLVTLSLGLSTTAGALTVPCRASMSNPRPPQYSTTNVLVRTTPRAAITTTAYYRTKTTTHKATANLLGRASVPYRISDATPGFRVVVKVSVKFGAHAGSCSTSFTPTK
jgi:hypothetical protein